MRVNVQTLIWYLATHHDLGSPIVDLGSRQSPNQIGISDLRQLFQKKEYIGCDAVMGVGVDQIEDIEQLTFEDESIPTVLCLDTIEHIANPLQAMTEIRRIVAKDGIVVLTSHMYAPVHYDPDYWRFSPECFRDVLLSGFGVKLVLTIGDPDFPELVAGIATKAEELPFKIDWAELNSMLPWSYPFMFRQWDRSRRGVP